MKNEQRTPKFPQTYCSQCGAALGPGDAGVSSCRDHKHTGAVMTTAGRENAAIRTIEALGLLSLETQGLLLCAIRHFRAPNSGSVAAEVWEHIDAAISVIADDKREQEWELREQHEAAFDCVTHEG